MKKLIRFIVLIFLLLVPSAFLAACDAPVEADPAEQNDGVKSEEAEYLIGSWQVNQGRFGNKIFDFQEDGRLLIEDMDSGETIEMTYLFVGENTVTLSGYDEFNGSATLNFYEDKLDFTINFAGTIFGELYVFTRVEDSSE